MRSIGGPAGAGFGADELGCGKIDRSFEVARVKNGAAW
jgi:hypothetical protein